MREGKETIGIFHQGLVILLKKSGGDTWKESPVYK